MPPELAIEIELREEAQATAETGAPLAIRVPVITNPAWRQNGAFDLDSYITWLIRIRRQAAVNQPVEVER
jgi:hypothetical protein